MTITWSRCKRSAGLYFRFGGWEYQLHNSHFVARVYGGEVMIVGGYK